MGQERPRKRRRIAPLEPNLLPPSPTGRNPEGNDYALKKPTLFSPKSAPIQALESPLRGNHASESQWHNAHENSRQSNTSAFTRKGDPMYPREQTHPSMNFSSEPLAREKDRQSEFYLPAPTTTYSVPTPGIDEQTRGSQYIVPPTQKLARYNIFMSVLNTSLTILPKFLWSSIKFVLAGWREDKTQFRCAPGE